MTVLRVQGNEFSQQPELTWKWILPRRLQKGTQLCQHMDFDFVGPYASDPAEPTWTSDLQTVR